MSTQFLSDWDILSTQKFLSDFLAFSKLSTQFLNSFLVIIQSLAEYMGGGGGRVG